MKKCITIISLTLFALASFSQKPTSKDEFLKRSKNQKTAAWVLLGGGAGLCLIGLAVGNREESTFDDAASGAIVGGIGVVSMITSIPLFIASGRNKRKGMSMTLQNERILFPGQEGMTRLSYPAVSLKFGL